MKLLAIETATESCSAALLMDGAVSLRYQVRPRMHAELILPMMEALLSEAGLVPGQLDALAFGRGPGSFTGVRIAAGVAQGVAFAADLPVVPVSTLAALAQRGFRERGVRRLLTAFDARMKEVYWGGFLIDADGLAQPLLAEQVAAPESLALPGDSGWFGVGSGWQTYGERLSALLGPALQGVDAELLCSAADVAVLGAAGLRAGQAVAAEQALPVYLRDKVAEPPAS